MLKKKKCIVYMMKTSYTERNKLIFYMAYGVLTILNVEIWVWKMLLTTANT